MARATSYTKRIPAGIPGLFRLLNALPKESQNEVRDKAQAIVEVVAAEARSAGEARGGVWVYVAPTITAKRDRVPTLQAGGTTQLRRKRRGSSQNMAKQKVGNVLWGAEFGSDRYSQFDGWTGNDEGAGYAIYPTFRRRGEWIRDQYIDALMDAAIDASRRA